MAARAAFLNPSLVMPASFGDARMTRYKWLWETYNNTAYDKLQSYIAVMGYPQGSIIYKYTMGLYNPVGRWVDFYVANIWGGPLDADAGDGKEVQSALPILTDNEALRPAIAKVLQWSNFGSSRQLATRYSTALGDLVIRIADNPRSKRVYLQFPNPMHLKDCQWDDFGFVKRAVFEWPRRGSDGKEFTYREILEHPSIAGTKNCYIQTFKDGEPFDFTGAGAAYELPYDFVPVVTAPWESTSDGWGAVGYARTLRKIDAANSIATMIAAQIGKVLNSPLAITGAAAKDLELASAGTNNKIPVLFFKNPEVDIDQLVQNMSLVDALAVLNRQLDEIRDDLPELRLADAMRSGQSGEALGRAFSDIMARVQAIRAGHDAALVRAIQMAIGIAGASGYASEFSPFNLDSYNSGKLDFYVGDRPILPKDSDAQREADKERWEMYARAITALDADGNGLDAVAALVEIMGWSKEKARGYVRNQMEDVIPGER